MAFGRRPFTLTFGPLRSTLAFGTVPFTLTLGPLRSTLAFGRRPSTFTLGTVPFTFTDGALISTFGPYKFKFPLRLGPSKLRFGAFKFASKSGPFHPPITPKPKRSPKTKAANPKSPQRAQQIGLQHVLFASGSLSFTTTSFLSP